MAGNEDANDPFIEEEVTPAVDGSVSVTARVPATGQVPAKPGSATAVVVCSDGSGFLPLAVGLTNFTVVPAAVAPAKTPTTRAASATPQLANTGSDTAPLTAIALTLIAAGGVAIRIARRA
jgi:LPXTG-motif cell wall-anchored protein